MGNKKFLFCVFRWEQIAHLLLRSAVAKLVNMKKHNVCKQGHVAPLVASGVHADAAVALICHHVVAWGKLSEGWASSLRATHIICEKLHVDSAIIPKLL